MALESATYISDLVTTNPTSSDPLAQGDDHLRLLKSTLKATFPNVSGAVTPTHTELNYVDGVTSSIQTQLDNLSSSKANVGTTNTFVGNQTITGNLTVSGTISGSGLGAFPSGTKMLFQQTSAPTGWTKDTTHDNKALRVVSGVAGSGGSVSFTSAFTSRSVSGSTSTEATSGTVGDTTLTLSQIPSHSHSLSPTLYINAGGFNTPVTEVTTTTENSSSGATLLTTAAQGGGGSHTHTFTGSSHSHTFSGSVDMSVQYVDLIIATKD